MMQRPRRTAASLLLVLAALLALASRSHGDQTQTQTQEISHFNGLRALTGNSFRWFTNRFRRHLKGATCLQFHEAGTWWHYEWCEGKSVRQFHPAEGQGNGNGTSVLLGVYAHESSPSLRILPVKNQSAVRNADISGYYAEQMYAHGDQCSNLGSEAVNRSVAIHYQCCVFRANETYIEQVSEPSLCQYTLSVCTPVACGLVQKDQYVMGASTHVSEDERLVLAQTVKDMFYHAYDGYMTHAYPQDVLRPISCRGESFELGKIRMLTLIDTLDTLALLQDAPQFQHAVKLVLSRANFNLNTEVSVFETTIRVLGGLLSAHLLALDESLGLYAPGEYKDGLLTLAIDLGDRLMPAFKTPTGIPYGTVNLRYGVPKGETTVASTAGAGSLSMEFTMLSVLTGDPQYADAARGAVRALFQRRSPLGLLGKHIDTKSGDWVETTSGPGSNSDSFYEYLLKMYMTFNDEESFEMFAIVYEAVLTHNLHGDWYGDVSMWTGCGHGHVVFENLAAFWPGMQASLGHLHSASRSMNSFYRVWREYGFVPEQFNVLHWRPVRGRGASYPLRPELIESTFYMHEATQDASWLRAGAHFVHTLQKYAKTKCGYATIANIDTKQQEDDMPSFFLSETSKYLYLLFNTTHFYRNGGYVMTTEAHPFPILPAKLVDPIIKRPPIIPPVEAAVAAKKKKEEAASTSQTPEKEKEQQQSKPFPVLQCAAPLFWSPFSYQLHYEGRVVDKTERCKQPVTTQLMKATVVQDLDDNWLPQLEKELQNHLDQVVDTTELDESWIQRLLGEREAEESTKKEKEDSSRLFGGDKLGYFSVEQLDSCLRVMSETTGDWLETTGATDSNRMLVTWGKGMIESPKINFNKIKLASQQVYDVIKDKPFSVRRRCQLNIGIAASRVGLAPDTETPETEHEFPCVGAAFGSASEGNTSYRSPRAGIVMAEPIDACGPLSNSRKEVEGKIVVVTRGLCFFETKALHAAGLGAVGVIVVNHEDEDRVMVMASNGMDSEREEQGEMPLQIPVVMVPKRLATWMNLQVDAIGNVIGSAEILLDITPSDTEPSQADSSSSSFFASSMEEVETERWQMQFPFVDGEVKNFRAYGPDWGLQLKQSHKDGSYTISIVNTPERLLSKPVEKSDERTEKPSVK